MKLQIRTDRPFGMMESGSPVALPLDSAADVLVDQSISLNLAFARRHAERFAAATGIRMKVDPRTKAPYSYDEMAKVVRSASIGKSVGWQEMATVTKDGKVVLEGEKESGGAHWYNNREEMGVFADSKGVDLDKLEKVIAQRGSRLLYPRSEIAHLDIKDGVVVGRRSSVNDQTVPMSSANNADAIAINYLHEFQYQLSQAGRLRECVGEQVDIPAGAATYQVPILGYGQMYKQGGITTESYTAVPAVTPKTGAQTWTPFKLMMSMWAQGEFEEDAIAPWLAAMERAAMLGRGIALDHLYLRGHTATDTTNINAYGITALGSKDPRLCANGFQAANYVGTLGGGATLNFKGIDMGGQPANLNMVAALRVKLNKYGLDGSKLRLIVGATTRAQFTQDPKARPDTYSSLLRANGDQYTIDQVPVLTIADSIVTNASTSGLPNYDGWNSEGNPLNLAPDGRFKNDGGGYTTATLIYPGNWVQANKRSFVWLVVRLPLSDQLAVVGSERFDVKPVHDSVSEAVAYGLAA